jgi:hypothetical protein
MFFLDRLKPEYSRCQDHRVPIENSRLTGNADVRYRHKADVTPRAHTTALASEIEAVSTNKIAQAKAIHFLSPPSSMLCGGKSFSRTQWARLVGAPMRTPLIALGET